MNYATKKFAILFLLWALFFFVSSGHATPLTSTLQDQQSMSITIYNSNVGLVKDTRLIDLQTGVQSL
ncbi:MAG: hypothetical protein ABSB32_02560 [Thermodesulfobacteriota bacterium]|jgi:hypothetical protein